MTLVSRINQGCRGRVALGYQGCKATFYLLLLRAPVVQPPSCLNGSLSVDFQFFHHTVYTSSDNHDETMLTWHPLSIRRSTLLRDAFAS